MWNAKGKITGYELGKQIVRGIGSAFGGGVLEFILVLFTWELAGIPGIIASNRVGSLGGEILMENLYEENFIEGSNGLIYWIWKE